VDKDKLNLLLKQISSDIAYVQVNSDVLAQWPISSVEAMYYLGPFFVPSLIGDIKNWPVSKEDLFEKRLFPGRLSNLLFFLLEKNSKKKMGPMHSILVNKIIETIVQIKDFDLSNKGFFRTWVPENFCALQNNQGKDLRKLVFLLDNLTELSNPIFRAFGMQFFANDKKVYRYYYNIALNFEILVVSNRKEFLVDFFEHVLVPEDLSDSVVYSIKENKISLIDSAELQAIVFENIASLSKNKFDKEYVFKSSMKSFGFEQNQSAKEFLLSPFPKEILDFYIKTCLLPQDLLSGEIYKTLGGD
jgi:hypothetical protein